MSEISYPVVDDADRVIGHYTKDTAYTNGFLLRSVQVFLFDSAGRLFVQKRSLLKKRFPGYFCAAAAGHVEPGESYEAAASRELKEELGVVAPLTFVITTKTPVGDHEYAMMAHYTCVTNDLITLQASEVESGAFYTIDEIKLLIADRECYTPSFLFLFRHLNM